ncbi:MAG: XisI protein [Anaerolineae bacterium]|nr:XisI protein [Anaerolineae bacterium]
MGCCSANHSTNSKLARPRSGAKEVGVANELVELGVPKAVLAYHAPYERPYTGFAVA